ncbi:MAG: uridine diphosphate-N-acetylglucosamine-binding protein YvcK [Actinomycetaceae bacterium]|nr:uridine diphosphate-N-acetylglucosamine-binding protein YvcK [Actinomycetaceae bacterium]
MTEAIIDDDGWTKRNSYGPAVVAFGGGHGLSATLRALRHVTRRLTAIVTVADDGGSSGRLRHELGILPPGDLRMALASLCDDSQWGLTWRDAMQHRFHSRGDLDYHALGNLLIATMWDMLDDTVEGLDWVAKLLGCHGRVLPMASVPVDIYADVDFDGELRVVHGQSHVAATEGKVVNVHMTPSSPPAPIEALMAIEEAEFVVLGPGSWYTSVIPHLLSQQLHDALKKTSAKKILVANLAAQKGETEGLSVADHLKVFHQHAPDVHIDAVIVDPSVVDIYDEVETAVSELGADLLLREVIVASGTPRHDSLRLGAALRDTFQGYNLQEKG